MKNIIVHNNISISIFGISKICFAVILIYLVEIMEEMGSDSLLFTDYFQMLRELKTVWEHNTDS
jgi:hypothetical protein